MDPGFAPPMLATTAMQGIVFGLLTLPICVWVAYTDLSRMKIRNAAVLTLLAVFVVAGPIVLPLDAYLLRFGHLAVVLGAGFVLSSFGAVGAGDAKFAAAMAPFVAVADAGAFLILFAVMLILTYTAHRLARRIGPLRALAPDWKSWSETRDFPLGVTLGATLIAYLGMATVQ